MRLGQDLTDFKDFFFFKFSGKKIYRVKAIIPTSAKKLIEALSDTEKLTDWNTTLTKHEILKVNK